NWNCSLNARAHEGSSLNITTWGACCRMSGRNAYPTSSTPHTFPTGGPTCSAGSTPREFLPPTRFLVVKKPKRNISVAKGSFAGGFVHAIGRVEPVLRIDPGCRISCARRPQLLGARSFLSLLGKRGRGSAGDHDPDAACARAVEASVAEARPLPACRGRACRPWSHLCGRHRPGRTPDPNVRQGPAGATLGPCRAVLLAQAAGRRSRPRIVAGPVLMIGKRPDRQAWA